MSRPHQRCSGAAPRSATPPARPPGRGEDQCLEYTALINIRPAEGNRSMEIADEALRRTIREITFELIGRGEEA